MREWVSLYWRLNAVALGAGARGGDEVQPRRPWRRSRYRGPFQRGFPASVIASLPGWRHCKSSPYPTNHYWAALPSVRSPHVLRWPCHVDEDKLRALDAELRRRHRAVTCSLVTEFGPYDTGTNVPLASLIDRRIALRWKELYFNCAHPYLQVVLRDRPYHEVTISWEESEHSAESARLVKHIVSPWRRWSLLPAHFVALLVFFLVLSLAFYLGKHQLSKISEPSSTAEVQTETPPQIQAPPETNRRIPAAQRSMPKATFQAWLGALVRALVAAIVGGAVAIGIILGVGKAIEYMRPRWSRLFPAMYFDLPSCRHHYSHNRFLAIVTVAANAVVSKVVGSWLADSIT